MVMAVLGGMPSRRTVKGTAGRGLAGGPDLQGACRV
jgi:hypothetical protein